MSKYKSTNINRMRRREPRYNYQRELILHPVHLAENTARLFWEGLSDLFSCKESNPVDSAWDKTRYLHFLHNKRNSAWAAALYLDCQLWRFDDLPVPKAVRNHLTYLTTPDTNAVPELPDCIPPVVGELLASVLTALKPAPQPEAAPAIDYNKLAEALIRMQEKTNKVPEATVNHR